MIILEKKLYYEKLIDFRNSMKKGLSTRKQKLSNTKKALANVAGSQNLKGATAGNIQNYIREVHIQGIITTLETAIDNLDEKLEIYVGRYLEVDGSGGFQIIDADFEAHQTETKNAHTNYEKELDNALKIMHSVDDIIVPSGESTLKNKEKKLLGNLTKMHNIARDQQENWSNYEKQSSSLHEAAEQLTAATAQIVSLHDSGKMPTMENYSEGKFGDLVGDGFLDFVNLVGQQNSQLKEISSKYGKQSKQVKKAIDKAKKEAEEQEKNANRMHGWGMVAADVVFLGLSIVAVGASGGAALPVVLGLGALAFNTADTAADLDQAITGKKEGYNVIKSTLQSTYGKNTGSNIYDIADVGFNVMGSKGAFKAATDAGIFSTGVLKNSLITYPKLSENVALYAGEDGAARIGKAIYGKEIIKQSSVYVAKKQAEPFTKSLNSDLSKEVLKKTDSEFIQGFFDKSVKKSESKVTGGVTKRIVDGVTN